jgi:hypothetical protein
MQIIPSRCFDGIDLLENEFDEDCLLSDALCEAIHEDEDEGMVGGERKKSRREEVCAMKVDNDHMKAFLAHKGLTKDFYDWLLLRNESS